MRESELAPDSPTHNAAGWFAVTILLVLFCVSYLDRHVLTLLIDPIKADLGLSDVQVSLLTGFAFVLLYSVSSIPIGWAVDRYSRRRIIFIGVMIWATAATLCGLARNFWQMLLARFGVGAGEAALMPAAYSIISDLFPKQKLGLAISTFNMGGIVGSGIALAVGGLIIGAATAHGSIYLPGVGEIRPWQQVVLLAGLPGLFIGWMVFLIPDPRKQMAKKGPAATVAQTIAFGKSNWRFYVSHMAGFSIINMMAVSFLVWAPTYLHRSFGWELKEVGVSFGIMMILGGLTGAGLAGFVADTLFGRGVKDAHLRIYVWGVIVLGACGVAAVLAPSPVLFFVFGSVVTALKTMGGVAASSLQIVTPPDMRGKVSAVYLFVFNMAGAGVGPALVAVFTDYLFKNPLLLGQSLALNFVIFTPLAALVLAMGLKPMRMLVEAGEAASAAPAK